MKIAMTIIALAVIIGGCASIDRLSAVKFFEPAGEKDGFVYFRVVIVADGVYPHDDEGAEEVRMKWIAQSLKDNGRDPAHLEVTKREFSVRWKSLIGIPVGDVYYTIRVPVEIGM